MNDGYKRPCDLAVVVAALVLLSPFWLPAGVAVALAIRIEDGGPVLYRQTRLGRGGRPFRILKLRTMVVGAEDGTGPVRAARRDARVTAVGQFLRRFHLDELPQVVNVLRGEMSLVGPRPERPVLAARFEREAPGFARRLRVRPGVMGLAQASGSYHWSARRKLQYDCLYIDSMSPWLDLRIALRCVRRALRGARRRGAPSAPSAPRRAPRPPADVRRPFDYLLVVGPGRSGSTLLYRLLNGHAAFGSPAVKEACYYRSPRRFERALRRLRAAAPGAVLLDVANLAWRDPWLPAGVEELGRRGRRVLLVVLLREHRARAVSVMAFRRSRGAGGGLERAAVRDSLTPGDLARLFGMGVDVVTIDFRALVGRTGAVLDVLADLCGVPRFGPVRPGPVNAAVRARSRWLAAAGKLTAVALRGLGCRRLLQRLKDSPWVTGIFFLPGVPPAERLRLGVGAGELLAHRSAACRRAVEASSERLAAGVWLSRSGARREPAGAAPDRADAASRPRGNGSDGAVFARWKEGRA